MQEEYAPKDPFPDARILCYKESTSPHFAKFFAPQLLENGHFSGYHPRQPLPLLCRLPKFLSDSTKKQRIRHLKRSLCSRDRYHPKSHRENGDIREFLFRYARKNPFSSSKDFSSPANAVKDDSKKHSAPLDSNSQSAVQRLPLFDLPNYGHHSSEKLVLQRAYCMTAHLQSQQKEA